MKLGIMQPYFFPYIGYWQLINAVDQYVIYDDVNFHKRGWINRNLILINGQPKMITLSLQKQSQNKLINESYIHQDPKQLKNLLDTIYRSYRNAPYFNETIPLIEDLFEYSELNLSRRLIDIISSVCEYLYIDTELIISSDMNKNGCLKGTEKIFSICKILKADHYINAIGGKILYSKDAFEAQGIKLDFLKTDNIYYKQFNYPFVPNLSIIDIMMFNSKKTIKELLEAYSFV